MILLALRKVVLLQNNSNKNPITTLLLRPINNDNKMLLKATSKWLPKI